MSNFSAINYALSKKLDNAILSGVVSHSVDNINKTITFTFSDGTSSTIQFNNPTNGVDGVGIVTMYKDTNNHLIVSLTDGSNIDVGELPIGNATGIIKEITNITYVDSKLTFTFSDGTKKIVNITPKLTELTDVSITSPSSGQVLVYNGATNKFINSSISTTDKYVKMTSADITGSYLADLIDNDSIINNNNKLEVNKIKGQQITVDELNTLIGMDANVKDSLNALATGGMVFKDVVPSKADLPQGALNGYVYIVNSDESDNGNRNAYIYSDEHGDYVLVGTSGLETRNFTTNPINLETEVTGILPTSKIDTTGFVNKSTDVVSSLTYPIPDGDLNKIANLNVLKQINTEVANALNNKLDKSAIVTVLDNTATDDKVPSAKAIHAEISKGFNGVLKDGEIQVPNNDMNELIEPYYYETVVDTSNLANFPPVNRGITRFKLRVELLSPNVGMYKQEIEFQAGPINQGTWYRSFIDGNWSKWQRVCTTTVEDVEETKIEIDETALGLSIINNQSSYKVINGICYVTIVLNVTAPNNYKSYGYTKINTTNIPIIGFNLKGVINVVEANSSISLVLDKGGSDIKLHGNIGGREGTCILQGSISYPVAE